MKKTSRKQKWFLAGLLTLVLAAGMIYYAIPRGPYMEPSVKSIAEPVKPTVDVNFTDLSLKSVDEAKKMLRLGAGGPIVDEPVLVPSNTNTRLDAPTVITATCYDPGAKRIYFEVANAGQVSPAEERNYAKGYAYQSRLDHIAQETGCRSKMIGVSIEVA